MGRIPVPAEIKKLRGTYRPDRDGKFETLPHPGGAPKKPRGMRPAAAQLWDVVVPRLVLLKIASELDATELQGMCEWWAEYRELCDAMPELNRGLRELAVAINSLATAIDKAQAYPDQADELLRITASALEEVGPRSRARIDLMAKAWKCFEATAERFGMSASDRRRLRDNEQPEDANPLQEYLAKLGASA